MASTDIVKAPARSAFAAAQLFHRIWPPAVIAFGLGLTGGWICLLGYGLFELVRPLWE
jgi:hypothetical protein